MIKVSQLNKFFGSIQVLKDINMEIKSGEVFGIVGHSGAGKSTLLRCLNGLESYDSGSVQVMDKEVKRLKAQDLLLLRSKMGMVFQNFNLMTRKNVAENVAFPMKIWGLSEKDIADKVSELLNLVGLSDKHSERVNNLSGGQKQRVGIARALALSPKILLCDEATSALDPKTTMSILDLLQDINERLGLTIVLVTHQMEVVKRLCHRLLMLDGGVEQGMGRTEDLFLDPKGGLRKMIEDEYTLIPSGTNIRLHFPRDISQNAVITTMARELDVDFSIVGGKLERYLDDVMGFLIINVSDEKLDTVINYLKEKKLYWQIIQTDNGLVARY